MGWKINEITAPIAKARVQAALGMGGGAEKELPSPTGRRPGANFGDATTAQAESRVTNGPPIPISTDEAKLNKTEKAFLEYLRYTKVRCLHVQAITLKLAFDCRLTPDFSYYSDGGQLTLVDVKGFQREDALIKMKVAARTFPEWCFVIVKRIKGEWKLEEIKP